MASVVLGHGGPFLAGLAPASVVVVVDVFRATTTLCTAALTGRPCYAAASMADARQLAAGLPNAVLAGEVGGTVPAGFELDNSPVAVASTGDARPLVLLTSSGTPLLRQAAAGHPTYAGCLRNVTALAGHLEGVEDPIAVVGAGTQGEFREEDQLGCARIAAALLVRGHRLADPDDPVVRAWADVAVERATHGRSAAFLRTSGKVADLEFVLAHLDDVREVHRVEADGRVVTLGHAA